MKKILNLLPIFTFFIFYRFYDIFIASKSLIFISGLTCLLYWIIYKEIDKINLFSFITIAIFGSLTIIFHNSQFIKWKITIIYMIFSVILFISQFFMKKPIIQRFLEKDIKISDLYWKKINFFWALFFLFCSILNIYVALCLPEKIWVNFKVFGLSFLMFLSILITSIYINFKMLKEK
ncbi:septation protein A [Buchnera aphidicola]|uniref:Inner membrane-spanning protein YciB n=1 Tax=Buchnera aphidicola subsp. Schizaphis graminum (strain Sg) TaxID=198804 RepID=YCIB_BUCAP|nr:septation protein A [Buchnera aphidicola]P42397.1 RecName: Full=Inner membrane-spanning protein YciB [Buchnera aphidicola str. Sg (Schizaphis graminum)]AAM67822.1 probable intracellular septation protein [Buchnera aphidicola str. Sg (Schizaphis graminum)]AWI49681.1 intracellular septation protein A [Buchnera aphidicola (Schizaphis graminum)]CAA79505.1 ORF 6 [Buchnera aphidicola]